MRRTDQTHKLTTRFSVARIVVNGLGRQPTASLATVVVFLLIATSYAWAHRDWSKTVLQHLRSENRINLTTAVTNGNAISSTNNQGSNLLSPTAVLLSWNTFGNAGTETTEPSTAND